jgi:polar amino acid transport system substrate-binding protein
MHTTKTALCGASALALTLGLALTATSAQAATPICGETYTIAPGDSLSGIAYAAYGASGNFQIIYSANADVIGKNPGLIKVGSQLQIPCLDTEADQSIADASAITEVATTEQLPGPNPNLIRIAVGSGWAPFTEETLEQGGMITEITNVSMAQSSSKPEYRIDFIKDWGAHLNPLISDHLYDLSIAWFRPNCNVMDLLSEDSKFRCNNLDWSESLYEQVFGYYTRIDTPEITEYAQLLGKKVCRPEGYSTFMMEEEGLSEPAIELIRAASPEACFNGLVAGSYDAVALAHDTAQSVMATEGLKDQVSYNEGISQSLTLHAVTAKTNPKGKAVLAKLDDGIKTIKANGEWFKIIRRHLNRHLDLVN